MVDAMVVGFGRRLGIDHHLGGVIGLFISVALLGLFLCLDQGLLDLKHREKCEGGLAKDGGLGT
jgi:hypothetical protein